MNDLISRSETVAAIRRLYTNHGKVQMGINLALDAVEEQPSVPAEVVRHGRWVAWIGGHPRWLGCFCSVCKNHADNRFKYCPNCGARMDGNGGQDG